MNNIELNIPIACLAKCLVELDKEDLKYIVEYVFDGEVDKIKQAQEILKYL